LFADFKEEVILRGEGMTRWISTCRGQVAALYAVILVTLVGAIALGTDVAVMYVNWQHMQKVADAAALAGANYLAGYTFSGTAASGCGSEPEPQKRPPARMPLTTDWPRPVLLSTSRPELPFVW
jgi:putative Flp pilus-assembly TadE/G-like protein